MTKDESLKQANDIAVGVDVTQEGTHVIAMRLNPNGVNEVVYSQFHPMAQPQERYTYGTPLLDAMVGCPPCNNHCNQGRTCPNRQTRKTTREEKITNPGIYEVFDELYAEQLNERKIRNDTLEEIAAAFDKMPFGDTGASICAYIRGMKR